jgi:hypothetical protein
VGSSVAVSGDGSVLAVGAPGAEGVYVYRKVSGKWVQTNVLDAGNVASFGSSVAISANGSTIVVGVPTADSLLTGGIAIYKYRGGAWKQTALFTGADYTQLGSSVAVNGTGTTVAAVAGNWPGSGTWTGGVLVWQLGSSGWTLKSTITAAGAHSIGSVFHDDGLGLSADGSTLVVGNPGTSSEAGSLFVFHHASSGKWVKTATLKASDGVARDEFAYTAAISGDGSTIVAGAPYHNGQKGALYVFRDSSGSWKQTAELAPSTAFQFGFSVAVSADGSAVLVGDPTASGLALGDAVVYSLSAGKWTQTATVAPRDAKLTGGQFGNQVALSGNGSTAVVGAPDQTDGTARDRGAAYVYVK